MHFHLKFLYHEYSVCIVFLNVPDKHVTELKRIINQRGVERDILEMSGVT